MPEPTTPADAQAANAGDTSAQAATKTTPDAQAADGQEPITLEEARRLRSEGKALRDRLKAFEDAEKKRQDAQLSEMEKANQRAEAAEARIKQQQQQLIAAQVKLAAQAKGIINPDLIAPYLADKLEYDAESGMPANLEKVLNDLLTQNPYLTQSSGKPAPTSGGATNPSRSASTSVGQITRENLGEMMAKYDKLTPSQQAEVQRLLISRR
jgi:hypothetical protein